MATCLLIMLYPPLDPLLKSEQLFDCYLTREDFSSLHVR